MTLYPYALYTRSHTKIRGWLPLDDDTEAGLTIPLLVFDPVLGNSLG